MPPRTRTPATPGPKGRSAAAPPAEAPITTDAESGPGPGPVPIPAGNAATVEAIAAALGGRVEVVAADDPRVHVHPLNPRRGDVPNIVESMRVNGFYGTVVVNERTGDIVIGNHRYQALRAAHDHATHAHAGWERWAPDAFAQMRVEWIDVDEPTALRYLAVDNATSDRASYDDRLLADVLTRIRDDVTLTGSGWDDDGLAALLERNARLFAPEEPPERLYPDATKVSANPTTRAGEVWTIGPHRLLCGSSREAADVATLLAGTPVNLAVTSPPYADRREYDTATDFRPVHPDAYVEWYEPAARILVEHLAPDGSYLLNIKASGQGLDNETYVLDLVLAHARRWGWHWLTEFCWERNGIPKRVKFRFKNQYEPVYHFVLGEPKIRPFAVSHASDNVPFALGPGVGTTTWKGLQGSGDGRVTAAERAQDLDRKLERSTLLPGPLRNFQGDADAQARIAERGGYTGPMSEVQGQNVNAGALVGTGAALPGNRLPTFAGSHEATGHSAAFPVGLPAWFVRAFTDPGDAVYDPFVGSGSTMLAAAQEGRVGYGMELSGAYCDIVVARFARAFPELEAVRHDAEGNVAGGLPEDAVTLE